jgi:DNA repair protein RecN (Recombination protein N)
MLSRLHIENYVLIEHLDLQFESGFSVITGETGAGKSVLMGAISLILGQRADLRLIKEGASRCVVEAEFNQMQHLSDFFARQGMEFDPESCIIRRELYENGKSRAFVNDSPVALNTLRDLAIKLVDVHSQHESLLLDNSLFQLELLDNLAQSREELTAYRLVYENYRQASQELKMLEESLQKDIDEQDYLLFQVEQLRSAAFKNGEQEQLEQELSILDHAEEIKTSFSKIENLLSDEEQGICSRLKMALQETSSLRSLWPKMADAHERIHSAYIDLNDLQRDIARWGNDVEYNPQQRDLVQERLSFLYELLQKFKARNLDELLSKQTELEERIAFIEQGQELLNAARQKRDAALQAARQKAEVLSGKRKARCKEIENHLRVQLQQLGMPHGVFNIEVEEKALDEQGMDKVTFLFSANKNIAPQPIGQIASGGEISRLMLSLKALVASRGNYSCLLFDEIDAGVSGEIAHKMAALMQETALGRQVICITHLPQIAARGQQHYKVFKTEEGEQALSKVIRLNEEERVTEIALMLSGANLSQAAINNARHLIYGE